MAPTSQKPGLCFRVTRGGLERPPTAANVTVLWDANCRQTRPIWRAYGHVYAARMVATVDRPDCMAKGTSELLGAVSSQPMAPAPVAGLSATAALRAASRRRPLYAAAFAPSWPKGLRIAPTCKCVHFPPRAVRTLRSLSFAAMRPKTKQPRPPRPELLRGVVS